MALVSSKTRSVMDRLIPLLPLKKLTQFFGFFVLCKNYSTIKLIYENSTIPLLEPIVLGSRGLSSIIINHDLAHKNFSEMYTDQHSLIISVFDSELIKKSYECASKYRLNSFYHYLYISQDENQPKLIDELMLYAKEYRLANIAVMFINKDGSFNIFRITYDQDSVIEVADSFNIKCGTYNQIFYPKTNDLKGEEKCVFVLVGPPGGIIQTMQNKYGKQVSRIGGIHAYLATLIPLKINITLKVVTEIYSEYEDVKKTDDYVLMKNVIEKPYKADYQLPMPLEYLRVTNTDYEIGNTVYAIIIRIILFNFNTLISFFLYLDSIMKCTQFLLDCKPFF